MYASRCRLLHSRLWIVESQKIARENLKPEGLGQTASRLLDVPRWAGGGNAGARFELGSAAHHWEKAPDETSEVSAYTDAHMHACAALYLQLGLRLSLRFRCWCWDGEDCQWRAVARNGFADLVTCDVMWRDIELSMCPQIYKALLYRVERRMVLQSLVLVRSAKSSKLSG
jgi:hypothetical protein